MYENDMDAAQFITFEDVTVTSRAENTTMKRVKVAMDLENSISGTLSVAGTSHPPNNSIPEGLVNEADHVPTVSPKL